MMDYCVQDVRVNDEVYRKQFDWIKKNPKPIAMEVLATKICAQQVINGWGYDADAGEELQKYRKYKTYLMEKDGDEKSRRFNFQVQQLVKSWY